MLILPRRINETLNIGDDVQVVSHCGCIHRSFACLALRQTPVDAVVVQLSQTNNESRDLPERDLAGQGPTKKSPTLDKGSEGALYVVTKL